MKEETARKISKWWADKLRAPTEFKASIESEELDAALFVATENHRFQPEERVAAFEKNLFESIKDNLDPYFAIRVDYTPDETLKTAAEKSGFELKMTDLPWKTTMTVVGDKISVREGYGSTMVDIQ